MFIPANEHSPVSEDTLLQREVCYNVLRIYFLKWGVCQTKYCVEVVLAAVAVFFRPLFFSTHSVCSSGTPPLTYTDAQLSRVHLQTEDWNYFFPYSGTEKAVWGI